MPTYTEITTGQVDQDSPFTQALATAYKDNVEAYITTDPSAPFTAFIWQIEDGAEGTDPIYDFSVDGVIATIETPVFVSGWEYMLVGHDLSVNGAATSTNIDLSLFVESSSSYSGSLGIFTTSTSVSEVFSFQAHLKFPMWEKKIHFAETLAASHTPTEGTATSNHLFFRTSADTRITKAKINCADALKSFDAGKVYLLKRAEYGGR